MVCTQYNQQYDMSRNSTFPHSPGIGAHSPLWFWSGASLQYIYVGLIRRLDHHSPITTTQVPPDVRKRIFPRPYLQGERPSAYAEVSNVRFSNKNRSDFCCATKAVIQFHGRRIQ